jgi:hypothetical protein
MRFLAALTVGLFVWAGHSWGQVPGGTTATWNTIAQPVQHVSPTFKASTTDNTKTNLQQAKLTVDFGNGKKYKITKATVVVKVSGGQGIWNPAVSQDSAKADLGNNKWELTGADVGGTLYNFNPATDVRIEYVIEFQEDVVVAAPPGSPPPPAPPTLTATVGSKDIKPTVP